MTFNAAPDFETPADAEPDNVYEVEVEASDGAAATTQSIEVTVTDEDESTDPFLQEIQLETRSGAVTIIDTTGAPGEPALTQIRDQQNPEAPGGQKGDDGLWDDFTGLGFLDMGLDIGDAAEFVIDAPEAGTYTFSFRYANGSDADRPMAVSVGGQAAGTIDFAPTPDWDQWVEAPIEVSLAAGENTIRIANTINTGPNLDRVVVTANVDEAPTAVELSAVTVAENDPGVVVADIAITDPDTTYDVGDVAIVGADAALFRVIGTPGALQLALADGEALDFEAGSQPTVTVSAGSVESDPFTPAPTDVDDTVPFETLYFQVESASDATILDAPDTLARTQTENQEKAGLFNPDQPGTSDDNPGLPQYDEYGIRPDYSGTGYVDLAGGAEEKLEIAFDAPTGTYDVTVRVAANSSRSIAVAVDGGAATAPQDANTTDFYLWKELTFSVTVDNPGTHQLVIAQTSGAGPNIDAVAISAPGAAVNFAPSEITSEAAFDVAENTTEVGTVEAKDIDGDDLSYAFTGGADQAKFTVDAATGVLSFVDAPDFETPGSDAGTNVYDVAVSLGFAVARKRIGIAP